MVTEQLVRQLLMQSESETLEFKERLSPFDGLEEAKAEFAKDMIALANLRRGADAYLVVGVKYRAGEKSEITGQENLPDPGSLQQFLDGKTNRPIRFEFNTVWIDGKKVGIFAVSKTQDRPIFLTKDFNKGVARSRVAYIRRAGTTDIMTPDEILQLAPLKRQVGRWRGEYGGQIRAMVDRWLRIFTAHSVQHHWIPELFPQFVIPMDMLTDWRDIARLLENRDLRDVTCEMFNVRAEWLDEGEGGPLRLAYLGEHSINLRPLVDFRRIARIPRLIAYKQTGRPFGRFYNEYGAMLIAAEIRSFGETPIYCYAPIYSLEDWGVPEQRVPAKLAMYAADQLGYELIGSVLPRKEMRLLRNGAVFPGELPRGRTGPWYPVDYVYRREGFRTKDPGELDQLLRYAERHGDLEEIRRAVAGLRLSLRPRTSVAAS